jgi:hypothetical protein
MSLIFNVTKAYDFAINHRENRRDISIYSVEKNVNSYIQVKHWRKRKVFHLVKSIHMTWLGLSQGHLRLLDKADAWTWVYSQKELTQMTKSVNSWGKTFPYHIGKSLVVDTWRAYLMSVEYFVCGTHHNSILSITFCNFLNIGNELRINSESSGHFFPLQCLHEWNWCLVHCSLIDIYKEMCGVW